MLSSKICTMSHLEKEIVLFVLVRIKINKSIKYLFLQINSRTYVNIQVIHICL